VGSAFLRIQKGKTVMPNPLDHVHPDFGVFGSSFDTMWLRLAGGLWALALLVAVGYLGHGLLAMAHNRNDTHPLALRHSKQQAVNAAAALGGLAALPVIVQAILAVASSH
jgi:hypothetical protein